MATYLSYAAIGILLVAVLAASTPRVPGWEPIARLVAGITLALSALWVDGWIAGTVGILVAFDGLFRFLHTAPKPQVSPESGDRESTPEPIASPRKRPFDAVRRSIARVTSAGFSRWG